MKKLPGSILGGTIGFIAPLVLAVGNETLFIQKQIDNGDQIWNVVQICAFERRWFPLYPKVIHAPGCQNKTLGILPGLLLISTSAGLAIGTILSRDKRSSRRSAEVISQDSSQITESIAVSVPEQTPIPLQRAHQDALKPQEPVASKPQLIEPLIKKLPKDFDLNHILRMSAIGGAVALAGIIAIAASKKALTTTSSTAPSSAGSIFDNLLGFEKVQSQIIDYQSIGFRPSKWKSTFESENNDAVRQACQDLLASTNAKLLPQQGISYYLDRGAKLVSKSEWQQNVQATVIRDGKVLTVPPPWNEPVVVNGICKGYEYILEGSRSVFETS